MTSVKVQKCGPAFRIATKSVSEEAETESQQEQGRWVGHQRSGGRVLKADGSIGDGFRAGTGDPGPDCPWAKPLEHSGSPGWTVGECARQAQSGARACCCTRSWVLRGLGSCRRLPSPQQKSSAAAKLRESEQEMQTTVYQTHCLMPAEQEEHTGLRGGAVSAVGRDGDVQSGREFHEGRAAGVT